MKSLSTVLDKQLSVKQTLGIVAALGLTAVGVSEYVQLADKHQTYHPIKIYQAETKRIIADPVMHTYPIIPYK